MRYVNPFPPIVEPPSAELSVKPAPTVEGIRPQSATALYLSNARASLDSGASTGRSWVPRPAWDESDRRRLCRRIRQQAVLIELRAGSDRRQRNQRSTDLTTAVSERI